MRPEFPELEALDHPDRTFKVWGYEIGHSWLLLRSNKGVSRVTADRTFVTRINVLFTNVNAISLPMMCDGLSVSVLRAAAAEHVNAAIGGPRPFATQRVFHLVGSNFSGSVIAGAMFVEEDDGDYQAPSWLWPVMGDPRLASEDELSGT